MSQLCSSVPLLAGKQGIILVDVEIEYFVSLKLCGITYNKLNSFKFYAFLFSNGLQWEVLSDDDGLRGSAYLG